MIYEIVIEDVINLIGRGTILVCELPTELLENGNSVKANDIISIDDHKYLIRGIENVARESRVGLVISHQYESNRFIGKTMFLRTITRI